jgi:LPS-assembly protein
MVRHAALLAFCLALLDASALRAQTLGDQFGQAQNRDAKLLVEVAPGGTTVYDTARDVITLTGDVKLYYDGRVLEADRIVYDRKAKRVLAQGNARLTEAGGTRYFGDTFELTDDFRDGFINEFRAVTSDNQRFSAPRVERTDGDQTVFERGTYTPCLPCKDNPQKAPTWQVKAGRIIAKNQEQMLYFENAGIEFWGVPVASIPFFSMPDPSVKRKTGFLTPSIISSPALGYGLKVPYFWAIAPNMDLTFSPSIMSRQGVLGEVEWRHRTEHGRYNIILDGIYQLDPGAFADPPSGPGERDFRGSIRTSGAFDIADKWIFGWNAAISTDRFFYKNYRLGLYGANVSTFLTDVVSSVYLVGQGSRSWFDLRGTYIQVLDAGQEQDAQPIIFPQVEYDRRFAVAGGELAANIELSSLERSVADVTTLSYGDANAGDPTCPVKINGVCSLLRGHDGRTTRIASDISWKRDFIDPIGQVWTPFAGVSLRAQWFDIDPNSANAAEQTARLEGTSGDNFQIMPFVGLDYRYPFFAATQYGIHTIEPVAQIIARPSENSAASIANADSQNVVFDDTNLFSWNRFPGDDRIEGGVRAGVGIQYTWNVTPGMALNAFAGRSFQLAGDNSYAAADLVNAGRNSGLDKDNSDYVGRLGMRFGPGLSLSARTRIDGESYEMERLEVAASGAYGDFSGTVAYSNFLPQPEIGFPENREGVNFTGRYAFTDNWAVFGSANFDLDFAGKKQAVSPIAKVNRFALVGASLGVSYLDECIGFTTSWTRSYSLALSGKDTVSDTYLVRLELKHLGDFTYSRSAGDVAADPTLTPSQ